MPKLVSKMIRIPSTRRIAEHNFVSYEAKIAQLSEVILIE